MDEYAVSFLHGVVDESTINSTIPEEDEVDHGEQEGQGLGLGLGLDQHEDSPDPESPKKTRGLRSGIFRAANIQDKLLEKLVSQVIPTDDVQTQHVTTDDMPAYAERPGFSLPLMTTNFRRFNARIGVVFKFQARVFRLLAWRRPTHTVSFLAVYSFVCIDPYLLLALPLAIALFGILVPSFVARHPAPVPDADRLRNLTYSPRGPPLAPARTVKPTKELSRDFFHNMGDLQNVMEDFSVAHDKVIAVLLPKTNFSDEALSSAVVVLLAAGFLLMLVAAHLLPLRLLSLLAGWAAILSGHPSIARWIHHTKLQFLPTPNPNLNLQQQQQQQPPAPDTGKVPWYLTPASTLQTLLTSDILLDTAPPTREVEIFELQHLSNPSETDGEWQPWLFTPSPYDPLSPARLARHRPLGVRFFEDVAPPRGWTWSEKKWALDLWSREWVEERIITGVEVETEGERWVYDMWNPREESFGRGLEMVGEGGGMAGLEGEGKQGNGKAVTTPGVSWEEGEGGGRRGQWRRRRWVRMVKRVR